MVGVPGRSKGCITCKRRKVKCDLVTDEVKPHCLRCSSAGFTCGGYATSPRFVSQVGQFRYDDAEALASTLRAENAHASFSNDSIEVNHLTPRARSSPPRSLSLQPFQLNICVSYTTARLFPHNPGRHPVPANRSWVLDAIETDITSVIHYATCCLSSVYFARVHSLGPNLIWDGALYYGKALRRLNDNLQDSSLFLSPANVAASFLLGIYELSAFENGSGWIRHAGGVGKLIEMRGAEFFRESPAREYFIVSRLPIISEALALRRRCFLDQEDWKTIPWLDEPRLKTSLHSVIDLLACVPRLREESDILKVAKADISSVPVREFCERLVNLMAELFLWRWRYERAFPGTAFEVASSEATSTREESASDVAEYPTILFYKHFHVARQPMLYNISLLMILDLATVWDLADTPTQALRRLPNEERPLQASNALVLPHEALTQEEILHEICRSLEFHLRGPHAAARGMVLLLPLRIAFTYVKDERQRAWLDQIVKRVSRTCGFRFSERVADTRSFAED